MMDDIAEQQDVAKEISEAISNPGINANNLYFDCSLPLNLFCNTSIGFLVYLYLSFLINSCIRPRI